MNRKPSLLRAMLKGFGAKYMLYGLFLFFDGIILKWALKYFIVYYRMYCEYFE